MIKDVESILRVCGIGSYLHIGCGQSTLIFEFLKRSIDAYGLDASLETISQNQALASGRFFHGSMLNYPFKPDAFNTIIISGTELLNFKTEDLATVLSVLYKMTKRNLVLYFPHEIISTLSSNRPESNRIFWEKVAISVGFRHHRRSMLINPYHELENEQIGTLTFFERVPTPALEQFPMSWLLQNRDLHMDMLREAGRRSDAHVSRYSIAANFIRPGDKVLDAACGLGYGTAVLSACSAGAEFIGVDIDPESIAYAQANFASQDSAISYRACDVTQLSFIPDHSIDTVISFETIEHIKDYNLFLKEVKRVLKPDGRFLGSVPNLWCDASGTDPNPHHFHVFDWSKLHNAISQYFIIDARIAQNAGGGFKLWNAKRAIWTVPLNQQEPNDIEWWIFSACNIPTEAGKIPFDNHFFKGEQSKIPVLVDFAKYYDNPWIYRVIVQLGERIADRNVLVSYCAKIANEARSGSADQGAALCVIAHQLLESGCFPVESVVKLIDSINTFDAAYDRKNLHAHRWAISLYFVAGRLLLAIGNRSDALTTFLTCASMDPAIFTPILATKTISSKMYAALILVGDGKIQDAQQQYELAIKEAHRVLQGDWKNIIGDFTNPIPFGLQEAAEVLDIASQCAQALLALKKEGSNPGYFWDRINLKRFGLVEWNKNVEKENALLRKLIIESKKETVTA